jgi:two-component system NtrC family sensor kinase
MFEQMPLGVVCVELDSMDEHTQYHMLLTLGTICSFASAGLVNARTISENATSVDVSSIIERTRLAAMNELAAAVAHQLNNPLTTIVADAEILLLRAEKGTRTHAALTAIERSGQRAAEVVRRLMAVVRPDKLNGIAQPVDVVQTVENVLLLVRQYIQVEKIDVVTKYSDERPVVWVTPDILGDVWLNLLMNARDALIGKENAQIGIEVRYEPGDEETYVLIGDNGIGIPEQEMKAIFEPFYSTKPTAERMGLGLHISKRIVDGLGGTVRVRSNENTGTTFIVTLPVKKGA